MPISVRSDQAGPLPEHKDGRHDLARSTRARLSRPFPYTTPGPSGLAPRDLLQALRGQLPVSDATASWRGIFHLGRNVVPGDDSAHQQPAHRHRTATRCRPMWTSVSPLRLRADGTTRYAWGRVVAHNLLAVCADAARRLRRQRAPSAADLHCQVEWFDDGGHSDDDEVGHARQRTVRRGRGSGRRGSRPEQRGGHRAPGAG
ncbi:MAG: hypothetical protein WKG07_45825 [Hymenobacter sp.]